LSETSVTQGDTVTAQATIKNTGGTSITLPTMFLAGRPPGGTNGGGPFDDFSPAGTNITLAPGQSHTQNASRSFTTNDPTGGWYCFATYETQHGTWHDDPTDAKFTVSAPSGGGGGGNWPASYFTGPLGSNEVLPAVRGHTLLSMWSDVLGNTAAQQRAMTAQRISDMGRGLDLIGMNCSPVVTSSSCGPDIGSTDHAETWIHSLGAIPFVLWSPDGTYVQIAAGSEDSEIDAFASRFKAFGHRVMLRLFNEFNGGGNGSWSPTDFIAAWRHVVARMQADGATNVGFVWCSEERAAPSTGATQVDESYPGDAYVDWVSTDHYNDDFNGSSSPDAPGWAEFSELFNYTSYTSTEQRWGPEKPFFVSETSSFYDTPGVPAGHTVDVNRKKNWFINIESSAAAMPYLIGIDFFDQDVHSTEPGNDYRVDANCDSANTSSLCDNGSTDRNTYSGFLSMADSSQFSGGVAGGNVP
jgi:hypothetical protein